MRTYLDRGVPLAGSSDSPVATHNPWIGFVAAVNRTTTAGTVLGAEEAISADEALAMYTTGGAFVLNRPAITGRIEPGAHADLIVLDSDPRDLPLDAVRGLETVATMVDGEWVRDAR